MKRIFILASLGLVFVITPATYVSAGSFGNYNLQGEYSFVGSRVCVQNNDGFSAFPDFALLSQGNTRTAHSKGVLRLKRNGTGTMYSKTMQVYHNQTSPGAKPISVWETTCEVEHERLPDGTIEMKWLNCGGPFVAGGGFPGSSGIDLVELSGEVSALGNILLLSDTEPTVETIWSRPEGGDIRYIPRLCTRIYTAVRSW